LDDEELFYLQARGIDQVQAERMLVEGFFRGVLDVIPDEKLREELLRNILSKLAEN
jgi:Fe-S cluster assembly protein SufD